MVIIQRPLALKTNHCCEWKCNGSTRASDRVLSNIRTAVRRAKRMLADFMVSDLRSSPIPFKVGPLYSKPDTTTPICLEMNRNQAQTYFHDREPRLRPETTGIKALIVGCGFAGLACAIECAWKGHNAVIFEKLMELRSFGTFLVVLFPFVGWTRHCCRWCELCPSDTATSINLEI